MKPVVIKALKSLMIFIISTILIYMVFTIGYFISWCNEIQLKLFTDNIANEIPNLDKNKVQELGDYVGDYAELLEYSLEEKNSEEGTYIIAEHYDPLGFSVWTYLREEIVKIIDRYNELSMYLGIATTTAYIIITSKNINNAFKFIIGYIGPMLIIPPIYAYTSRFRLLNVFEIYNMTILRFFYVAYTAIFVLIFLINYLVAKKMVKELNRTIIRKGGCYYEQNK